MSNIGDLDTAGMPAGPEPVEGGAVILNAAFPPGHPDHEVWRSLSNDERAAGAAARKANRQQRRQAARAYLRLERNQLLVNSDWTQIPDAPLTADQVTAFRVWRQQLRDFPFDTLTDPDDPPPFPDPPAPLTPDNGTATV